MTLEQCMADCTGFSYWGVEYGGECMLPIPYNLMELTSL
jgi:hypothetical protein